MGNLLNKFLNVSKSITYIEKDKTNKQQGYKYLSEAKIKEVVKKAFEDNGIIFNFSTDEVREYEISPTSRGIRQFVTIANGKYSFIDIEDGERIDGTWAGSGTDTGDKGLYKAITGGIKYVLHTNILVPTGDDPEKDDETDNHIEEDLDDLENLLNLAFTSEKTREAFVESFKGDNGQMIKVLKKRINKEVGIE